LALFTAVPLSNRGGAGPVEEPGFATTPPCWTGGVVLRRAEQRQVGEVLDYHRRRDVRNVFVGADFRFLNCGAEPFGRREGRGAASQVLGSSAATAEQTVALPIRQGSHGDLKALQPLVVVGDALNRVAGVDEPNGLRLAAGLDRPGVGGTPRTVAWSSGRARLMHYTAGAEAGRPAVLLVPSLINRSYIWDLRHGDSFVEHLLTAGYDVLCLDWGVPDARDAHNTLSTYVDDYMSAAVAEATRRCASAPIVVGHCFGGLIAVLWAASTEVQPRALITMAALTNLDDVGPLSWLTRQGRIEPEDVLDDTGNVPAASMLRSFQLVRPLGGLVTW
jgi:hypothetical protein